MSRKRDKKKSKQNQNNNNKTNNNNNNSQNKSKYDVKDNLKKLSQTRKKANNNYETQSISYNDDKQFGNLNSSNIDSDYLTLDKIDNLNDKIESKIFDLSEKINITKDLTFDKIDSKFESLRNEFNSSLDKKVNNPLFYGAVATVCLIAGIIYTLSYQKIVSDVEEIKSSNINIEEKIDSLNDEIILIKKDSSKIQLSTHN